MRYLSCLLFVLMTALPTGCVVVPLIDGFSQMGLSRSDREMLLPKQVKKFHEALYWGKPMEAVSMVKEESREAAAEELQKKIEGVRIVESKMESVQYKDESQKATVKVNIRHYKVPFYVVVDRIEEQSWEFSRSNGWQYVSSREVKK